MAHDIEFEYIKSKTKLIDFCTRASASSIIAFDTEFVSEDCYQPQLCLVQVATDNELAIIDPLDLQDLSPFWELIVNADIGHETVVHAAREEFRFCKAFIDRRPNRLVDTQIAAGLIGLEYPAAYSTLANRLLGETIGKGETRTNWRHRPLSQTQLDYAIKDVVFLHAIYKKISSRLKKLNRLDWLQEEMGHQQQEFELQEVREKWQRLSGIVSLQSKDLAVVRELWRWREAVGKSRNLPPRRILRDDLLVALAKRGISNIQKIRAIRGMEFGRIQRYLPDISEAIERGIQMPKNQWPQRPKKSRVPNLGLLGQFLATALGVICRDASIAPNLAGTTQDLRTMAAWRLQMIDLDETPRLMTGWRREVIGDEIDQVLKGHKSIRVSDPKSEQPLTINGCNH